MADPALARTLQRVFMFFTTVLYFPAVVSILSVFIGEYDLRVLALYGCTHVNSRGIPCCLKGLPTDSCMDEYAWQQASAFQVELYPTTPVCAHNILGQVAEALATIPADRYSSSSFGANQLMRSPQIGTAISTSSASLHTKMFTV
jgi:hypothetical protein